jgi:hypothetical protein
MNKEGDALPKQTEKQEEKEKLDSDKLQKLVILKLLLQAGVEDCECSDCTLRRKKEKQEEKETAPEKPNEEKTPPPSGISDQKALQNKVRDLEKRVEIAEFLLMNLFTSANKSCK